MDKKKTFDITVNNSSSSHSRQRKNAWLFESHFQRGIDYFLKDDFSNAFHWFFIAARHYHPEAQWMVGHLLHIGDGCQKDISNAVKYLSKASRQGVAYAKYELAACYYFGEGVEREMFQLL